MSEPPLLNVKCDDVLRDNNRWYAQKARRKKIALVRVEITNTQPTDVQVRLGATKLIAGGKPFAAENPAVILRKLSEFTWDFLLYTLLDFHPLTAVFEVGVLLTGPLYNRRLRRQLAELSDADITLRPGESTSAIVAFRGVVPKLEQITLLVRCGGTDEELPCAFHAT